MADKTYIDNLRISNKHLADVMDECKNAVREFVEKNGGFVDLSEGIKGDKDTIYGYAMQGDSLTEMYMYALRVKDGDLQCFLVPKAETYVVDYKKEDMLSSDNEDMWYYFDGGDYLYVWQTLCDMMYVLDEYDTNN